MRFALSSLLGLSLSSPLILPILALSEGPTIAQKPMRVLVVGAGSISREFALHHFTESATGTVVTGIVDPDEAKARELAADVGSAQAGAEVTNAGNNKYGATTASGRHRGGTPVPHFASLEEVLGGGGATTGEGSCDAVEADVVYIGTTPGSHRSLVEKALRGGKHVLLEKPIAASTEDADAIVAAADAAAPAGQVLAMNIGMRYNAALLEMKRRILEEARELGPASALRGSLRTHYSQWPREWQTQPWCAGREEGGPLREVGTHFFSALLEFAGAHDADAKSPVTARVRAEVTFPDDTSASVPQPCETSASGEISLRGGSLPPGGLELDLSVRTDAPRDLYELMIAAAHNSTDGAQAGEKSLTLFDFCSLRTETGKVLVRDSPYGRRECIYALVAAATGESSSLGRIPSVVTARHGRNAQLLLAAIIESDGKWLDVEFD